MANPTLDRITGIDTAMDEADKLKCAFIMLGGGRFALVDYDDMPALTKHSWHIHSGGYAIRRGLFKAPHIYMHRQILGVLHEMETDHINRNKLDNRKTNLRHATRKQNVSNNPRRSHNKASKFKGVRPSPSGMGWRGRGIINGKEKHLGTFKSEIEAARAYNQWAKQHFGEFAYLNPV